MSDEGGSKPTGNDKAKSDVVEKLIGDALGPAVEGFGKEVAVLGPEAGALTVRAVRVALAGVGGLIYGFEQIKAWIEHAVAEKLAKVPPDEIVPPSGRIAIPAIQAAAFSDENSEASIREMFANLIAADMTQNGKKLVHPSFVEIINQMSVDDARVMEHFCVNNVEVIFSVRYVDKSGDHFRRGGQEISFAIHGLDKDRHMTAMSSLIRLGLIEKSELYPLYEQFDKIASDLEKSAKLSPKFNPSVQEIEIFRHGLYRTEIGNRFIRACFDDDISIKGAQAEAERP